MIAVENEWQGRGDRASRAGANWGLASAFVAVAILLGAVTVAWAQSPVRGGTLKIGAVRDVVTLDPTEITSADSPYKWQVFDTLVRVNPQNHNLETELATSWDYGNDGLSLTFHLRKGVQFQDGSPFAASDVVANIDRIQDPKNGEQAAWAELGYQVDGHARSRHRRPHFAEPDVLAMDFISRLWIEKPEYFGNSTKAMGTGPFELAEWQPGTRTLLKRSKHDWKEGLPDLDAVDLQVLPDPQSEVANLQAGAEDLITLVPLTSLDAVKADPRFETSTTGANMYAIGFNTASAPLNDKRVRQALNLSMDRSRFARVFLHGAVPPMSSRGRRTHLPTMQFRRSRARSTWRRPRNCWRRRDSRRASHFLSRSRRKLRRIS